MLDTSLGEYFFVPYISTEGKFAILTHGELRKHNKLLNGVEQIEFKK